MIPMWMKALYQRLRQLEDPIKWTLMPFRLSGILLKWVLFRGLMGLWYGRRRADRDQGRVLVFCMGGIGDCVMATPVFENLAAAHPDWRIDAIVPFYAVSLFEENMPTIQNVYGFPDVGCYMRLFTAWRFLAPLYRANYDTYLSVLDFMYPPRLPHNLYGSIIGFLVGAHRRFGLYRQQFFSHRWWHRALVGVFMDRWSLFHRFGVSGQTGHAIDDRLNLLALMEIPVKTKATRLESSPSGRETLDGALAGFRRPHRPLVLFCPTTTAMPKQWSAVHFGELGRRLVDERDVDIVVAGADHEWSGVLIQQIIGPRCLDLSGKGAMPLLADYVPLAESSDCCVGLDSGLTHMAAAVNTPVVMIFGSSPVGFARPRPEDRHTVLAPESRADCPKCLPDHCPEGFHCINTISVATVFDAVVDHLDRANPMGATA